MVAMMRSGYSGGHDPGSGRFLGFSGGRPSPVAWEIPLVAIKKFRPSGRDRRGDPAHRGNLKGADAQDGAQHALSQAERYGIGGGID
jgi:hypothetical protein